MWPVTVTSYRVGGIHWSTRAGKSRTESHNVAQSWKDAAIAKRGLVCHDQGTNRHLFMDKALPVKDALDRKIIASLQANARQSTASIAAALGVARTTVHERISRMEERGVIKGYSVVLGQADETPMVQVIVQLSVNQPETAKIIARIGAYPEVKQCLSVNGEFDLIIIAEAPRIEDLDVLTDEFGAIPGVIRTKTHVVFSRRIDRN